MTNTALCTPAWLLSGITGSMPGVLKLANGRLAFTTEERRVFDVPLSKVIDVSFPWYYFGGGVKFGIGADRYRLSFIESNDAGDVLEGRRVGKAWKSVLVRRTSSQKL